MNYLDVFKDSFVGYGRYLWGEITNPGWHNYFYLLIAVSLVVFALEIAAPWRRGQKPIRKDFWLDAFYMFFNFFLFSLVGYAALSDVVATFFDNTLASFGVENLVAIEISSWPVAVQLLVMFIARDFIHWNVHRLLHRVPWLWEFHKVHHSVEQMGFAAHLRYHWFENVAYRTIEYIPLAMLGFGIDDFFVVHTIALMIGHLNHANFKLPLGPLKYVFNSPQMHIWHHAKNVPAPYGVNFGISLSVWDWLFGTVYWPADGRDEELGFQGLEEFPHGLGGQLIYNVVPRKKG